MLVISVRRHCVFRRLILYGNCCLYYCARHRKSWTRSHKTSSPAHVGCREGSACAGPSRYWQLHWVAVGPNSEVDNSTRKRASVPSRLPTSFCLIGHLSMLKRRRAVKGAFLNSRCRRLGHDGYIVLSPYCCRSSNATVGWGTQKRAEC